MKERETETETKQKKQKNKECDEWTQRGKNSKEKKHTKCNN